MSVAFLISLVACGLVLVLVATLSRRWIGASRRRRTAAALYTEVQLQLLAQAAVAALLEEVRHHLTRAGQRSS